MSTNKRKREQESEMDENITTADIAAGLREGFEDTAEWRREKATEYRPEDQRNVGAALSLDRLAKTVDQVDPKLLAVYGEEFDDPDAFQHQELLNEMLRQIGFDSDYETATDFLQAFINNALEEHAA
jgi:hypothetical protein